MGFFIVVFALALASVFQLLGHTAFAITIAGLDLLGLAAVFVYGRKAK